MDDTAQARVFFQPQAGHARLRRVFGVVLLACLLIWSVGACLAQTLQRGNGPEPTTLDAHKAQDLAAFNVLRDLYEGLLSENARGELIPGMAASWETDNDGLRWTFTLRDHLRWSDGSLLTAEQIVQSFQRAFDPSTLSPFAAQLSAIENAESILAGRMPVERLGVRAVAPRQIEIRLARPAPLLALLTLPIASPVHTLNANRHGASHTHAGKLLSNGAYRLVAWKPHAFIDLERNPFFHAANSVKIERVRFHVTEDAASEMKRFQAGDLHLTETVPPMKLSGLQQRFGTQLRISPYLGVFYYGINLRHAPLRDHAPLREALSLVLDRDILTRHVTGLGETPATSLVPPGIQDYPYSPSANGKSIDTANESQRATARAHLQQLGYSAKQPLRLELRYNTSSLNRKLALAVASMWQTHLPVRVKLVNEEWKVFVVNRRQARVTQVFRGGWIADYADAMSFLEPFERGQSLNATGFADAAFDAALASARHAGVPRTRAQALAQAEARVLAAHAIIPIYFYSSKHLVSNALHGFAANPLDHHPSRFLHWGKP